MRVKPTLVLAAALMAAHLALPVATRAATAPADSIHDMRSPWQPGRQWMSFRVGFAKSSVPEAADGSIGGGMGYARMLPGFHIWRFTPLRKYSLGASIQLDQLGRFGTAAEIEVPVTAELVRHYQWGTPYLRPYLGIGGGAFYRKLYRSGRDFARVKPGAFLTFGVNTPLDPRQVLGLDLRVSRVNGENEGGNPVFGPGEHSASHWSVKFNYAITY